MIKILNSSPLNKMPLHFYNERMSKYTLFILSPATAIPLLAWEFDIPATDSARQMVSGDLWHMSPWRVL